MRISRKAGNDVEAHSPPTLRTCPVDMDPFSTTTAWDTQDARPQMESENGGHLSDPRAVVISRDLWLLVWRNTGQCRPCAHLVERGLMRQPSAAPGQASLTVGPPP